MRMGDRLIWSSLSTDRHQHVDCLVLQLVGLLGMLTPARNSHARTFHTVTHSTHAGLLELNVVDDSPAAPEGRWWTTPITLF